MSELSVLDVYRTNGLALNVLLDADDLALVRLEPLVECTS